MDKLDLYWQRFVKSGRIEDYHKFFSMREAAEENPGKEDIENAHKNNGDSYP